MSTNRGDRSRGGSEATVRIARADLVPTDHNLRVAYEDFAELDAECAAFSERVNVREHGVTRRPPAVMLAEERARLHPLPAVAHTVCFGQTRRVHWQSTINVHGILRSRCAMTVSAVPIRAGPRARWDQRPRHRPRRPAQGGKSGRRRHGIDRHPADLSKGRRRGLDWPVSECSRQLGAR
jgi:hypothetical protein